jgi:hypothetical protein
MSYLEATIGGAGRLGLGAVFAEAVAYWRRGDELNAELSAARQVSERERAALVSALVDAKPIESKTLLPKAAAVDAWRRDGPAALLYVHAVKVCHDKATAAAMSAMPTLFGELQKLAGAVPVEVAELLHQLPAGAVDESSAFKLAGADGFERWMQISAAMERWAAVHALVDDVLRPAGWTAPFDVGTSVYDGRSLYLRVADPSLLPEGWRHVDSPRRLAVALARGAGPGLVAGDVAKARWEAANRRAGEVPIQQIQRIDPLDGQPRAPMQQISKG